MSLALYILYTYGMNLSLVGDFYHAMQLCWCGLGSRNSVCLSVCYTCVLWQNQTMHCRCFDTTL